MNRRERHLVPKHSLGLCRDGSQLPPPLTIPFQVEDGAVCSVTICHRCRDEAWFGKANSAR